jgi:hypothetical protein
VQDQRDSSARERIVVAKILPFARKGSGVEVKRKTSELSRRRWDLYIHTLRLPFTPVEEIECGLVARCHGSKGCHYCG